MNRVLIILLFFTVTFKCYGHAKDTLNISLGDDIELENIGRPFIKMHYDTLSKLTSDEVIKSGLTKELKEEGAINLGFTRGRYWFELNVKNIGNNGKFYLELAYPFHDYFEIYKVKETGTEKLFEGGDYYPFYQRSITLKNFVYPLNLKKGEILTLLIRLDCNGEASSFPVNIYGEKKFLQLLYEQQLLLGFFYGIIIFAIILSFFLVFINREKAQLYYFLYVLTTGLFQFTLDGFSFQFLWPENTWLQLHMIPISGSVTLIFLLLFTSELLNSPKGSKSLSLSKKVCLVLLSVLFVFSFLPGDIFYLSLKTLNLLAIAANILLLFLASDARRRGENGWKYFLIAFSVLIGMAILAMLKNIGVLPRNFITVYGIQIATAFEVMLLSLALADNLKLLKEEKQKAQAALLKELEEKYKIEQKAKAELEIKVVERTREIQYQKNLIEEKNKDITDSINYARRIQEALLPPLEDLENYFDDFFIYYRPRDIVSGDFYWFSARENMVFIAVADCTGHGVPGSLMSMLGSSFLNEIVNEYNIYNPGDILDTLRMKIIKTLRQLENQVNDGMDISICCIDQKKQKLYFAGAQNDAYLLSRNKKTDLPDFAEFKGERNFYLLKADSFPVGNQQGRNQTQFGTIETGYEKGDYLFMMTDGYRDQFGGPLGKKIKTTGLRKLIIDRNYSELKDCKTNLDSFFMQWKGDCDQTDDVLIAGFSL